MLEIPERMRAEIRKEVAMSEPLDDLDRADIADIRGGQEIDGFLYMLRIGPTALRHYSFAFNGLRFGLETCKEVR